MYKPLFHDALHAGRLFGLLIIGALALLVMLESPKPAVGAQTAETRADLAIRPEFREPVVLTSKEGVLEVRLTARQGQATLDTVATPVQNFLLFDYEVIQGTASDGQKSGGNLYPAPTLQVFPGERLIIHFENGLTGLTIRDYFSPQYTPKGQSVPIYPEQMTSSPINLHTHGAHISPKGNADNVLLHIPPGMSNTYTYDIPRNMPQGMYWYHSHLHGLTSAQVYTGLVGLLAIGRTDGNLPLVTEKSIPIRNMALQYNFVFDRAGGLAQLNNLSWPQWASTITPPKPGELANGTYQPSLAPVNFNQSKPGTKYFTVWYAGPLSIHNRRGSLQFIPSNLQHFVAAGGKAESDVPVDPSLPDYQRDVQFTVNGQFQPVIRSKAGQTEIWVLANVSDFAYMNVQLTETATGRHPPIAIVGQDGNPYTSGPISADRQWHAAAHSTGEPIRDCSDDTSRRRSRSRDAGARRRRKDDHRARRALHQQWNRQSSGRAGEPERPALSSQLCRRVLRLSNPGAGESDPLGRRRRNDPLHRRSVAWRLHVLCRPR